MIDARVLFAFPRRLARRVAASAWRRGMPFWPSVLVLELVLTGILCLVLRGSGATLLSGLAVVALHAVAVGLLATASWQPFQGVRRLLERARARDSSVPALEETRQLGRLGEDLRMLLEDFHRTQAELLNSHFDAVKAIALALEARDLFSHGHCLRVRYLTRRILDRLNVDQESRDAVELGALLHDVGKIGVPDSILLKPGKLTPAEYARIMMHVDIGVELLECFSSMREIVLLVKHHHERFDGKGYPDGLRGEQIPFGSRVIAVADAIDAMRSTRPYRRALGVGEAIQELEAGSGSQFDPRVVDAAVGILQARATSAVLAP